eukprot:1465585-Amphidinium_carterae.2
MAGKGVLIDNIAQTAKGEESSMWEEEFKLHKGKGYPSAQRVCPGGEGKSSFKELLVDMVKRAQPKDKFAELALTAYSVAVRLKACRAGDACCLCC